MYLLKRASARPTAAFGLRVLLSGTILLASGGLVWAVDKMVGGEFATKGIVTSTVGPNDAKGQPASVLTFTDDEVKKLHDGHYSAALLFQTSSDWADAVTRGAEDEFKTLGVEIAGLSNSNFSASDQAHAVQTIMAKKPSGIVTWPINPDELSSALKKAAEAGVKLALISNMPSGFQQGKDYTGLVGDDLYAMGQKTADNLAKAMGGEGELGFLYFDANAYVVNSEGCRVPDDDREKLSQHQDHPGGLLGPQPRVPGRKRDDPAASQDQGHLRAMGGSGVRRPASGPRRPP